MVTLCPCTVHHLFPRQRFHRTPRLLLRFHHTLNPLLSFLLSPIRPQKSQRQLQPQSLHTQPPPSKSQPIPSAPRPHQKLHQNPSLLLPHQHLTQLIPSAHLRRHLFQRHRIIRPLLTQRTQPTQLRLKRLSRLLMFHLFILLTLLIVMGRSLRVRL